MTSSVIEPPYEVYFTYGPHDQRIKSVLKLNGVTQQTKYFSGGYEKEVSGSVTKHIHYISGAYGLVAVLTKVGQTTTIYYTETDHLGSIIGLMNSSGTYLEQFSYDAWGRRRNPSDWTYNNVPQPVLLERGYTGHEHLDKLGLINMNGRMYDPVLGRFLGVDPVIQTVSNSQSFNGYSYCLNNPLKYTDPSGDKYTFWHLLAGSVFGTASWSGIIKHAQGKATIGQAIGEYFINAATFVAGAGTAQLGTAIGVSGAFPGMAYGASAGALLGGTSAGLNSALYGDNFWEGAKQGAIYGAIGGAIGGGISSGNDAFSKGNNVWWGNEVKNGRNQWSIINLDKPLEVIDFHISNNIGSMFESDCVPTTFAEAGDKLGGYPYEEYIRITGYIEGKGVRISPNQYKDLIKNNFVIDESFSFTFDNIRTAAENGNVISVLYRSGGINHADNLRSLIIYPNPMKSKVVFRAGSMRNVTFSKVGIFVFSLFMSSY